MTREKPDQIAAARSVRATLEAQQWDGGIRIVLQGAMQAIFAEGSADLHASWRADVFTDPKARRAAFTMVAETPEQVLRDVAALLEAEHIGEDGEIGQ